MATKILKRTEIEAYGKLNFSLDVEGTDERRYHKIRSIMQTIPVYDTVVISSMVKGGVPPKNVVVPDRLPLSLVTDSRALPTDCRNSAYRAAELMLRTYPRILGSHEDIVITIKKRIPVGGGLGGSSADSAAVVKGFNTHFGLGLGADELLRLGSRLGSDVPFMIAGGTALVTGTGEIVTPLPAPGRLFLLICYPGRGMDTWEVYRKYDELEIGPEARPDTEALIAALNAGDMPAFIAGLKNVLEVPAFLLNRKLSVLKDTLIRTTSAEKVLMSGSGSSFFCVFDKESKARTAMAALETEGNECMLVTL